MVVFGLFAASCAASAQSGPLISAHQQLQYEVSVIKPANPNNVGGIFNVLPSGLDMQNLPIRTLIMQAYGIKNNNGLRGEPSWVDNDPFTIQAKVDDLKAAELSKRSAADWFAQISLMNQALLRDCFFMKIRSEQRELSVLRLLVDEHGSKAREGLTNDTVARNDLQDASPQDVSSLVVTKGCVVARSISMAALAEALGTLEGIEQPVEDGTALAGKYNFELRWSSSDGKQQPCKAGKRSDQDYPGIFTALREQLGLRLVKSKALTDVFIVDRIGRPSPN
jgi:uncharacterized protein (TIGR03435 family)